VKFEELEETQRAAAQRVGQDVSVDAGPGSGKTRVLIARFGWLVRERDISPARILTITFTEKAATEIKRRLVVSFANEPAWRQEIERAYVSTIHGFCARVLRENSVAAGVDVDFAVLEEAQSDARLREAAEEALDGLFAEKPQEFRGVLESLYVSTSPLGRQLDLAGALLSVYEAVRVAGADFAALGAGSGCDTRPRFGSFRAGVRAMISSPREWTTPTQRRTREHLADWLELASSLSEVSPFEECLAALAAFQVKLNAVPGVHKDEFRRLREEIVPEIRRGLVAHRFAPERALLVEALERLDARYRERKRAEAALDFSDLEECTLKLFETRPAIAAKVRQQFDYILMDELQDTNPLQWRILERIRRPNRFFGVGDINQSIYGFRHADPELFRGYRDGLRAAGKTIDTLRANYRSRSEILAAVEAILAGASGIEPRGFEPRRAFGAKSQVSVEVIVAAGRNAEEAEKVEARWIARRIRELERELSIGFSGIVVLARKVNVLGTIEQALREFEVPALVVGGRTLLESREVLDAIHFLRVLANTQDEVALAGVLRSPLVGARDETILRLKNEGGLWGALHRIEGIGLAADQRERLDWFRELVTEQRRRRDSISPDRLAARIVDESDYQSGLAPHAQRNIEKFLDLLRDLYWRGRQPLAEVLAEIGQLRAAEAASEAPPAETADAVRLMTIHAAKGLEFPVVFVAALHQRGRSELDPICFSPRHGFGVKWRVPESREGVADPIYAVAQEELKAKNAAEEMRLLYVAMTRAEEHLALSYSVGEHGGGSEWSRLVGERIGIKKGNAECDEVRWINGRRTPARVVVALQAARNTFPPPAAAETGAAMKLEKPVVSEQHDSGAAVTHLGAFVACPRRYYLAHYLGLCRRERLRAEDDDSEFFDAGSGPRAAELGTQVHELLAGVVIGDAADEAVRLAEVFRRSDLGRRVERAARVEREFDFVIELEGLVLRGQIDLWLEEGGEMVLVDYKTDEAGFDGGVERGEGYALQLRLYALALEKLTGRLPDRAWLFYLRRGEAVPVALDDASLAAAVEVVRAFRRAQEELDFRLREGKQCRTCEFFRGACPAGR
jgi:ATP-dependent helicase/nuclease subunit A